MDIAKATHEYEKWLARHIRLVDEDLAIKHKEMASKAGPFPFFRATFYRWIALWKDVCPELVKAPVVLSVGDLHVENFGTWRDSEGRLIWGVNDFDEAFPLPYTQDLVRLASSALLAIEEDSLWVDFPSACAAILRGYRASMESGGQPWVLAEHHLWLRAMATSDLRDPVFFWHKLSLCKAVKNVPGNALRALEELLPVRPTRKDRVLHRQAGLGSLGRERYVLVASWHESLIAREAKAMAPSACVFAGFKGGTKLFYCDALDSAVRVRDPFVKISGAWLIRRLAPDCSRVELAAHRKRPEDELKLLEAMGAETANIHLGSKSAVRQILGSLQRRPPNWLQRNAKAMADRVKKDWKDWRAAYKRL